MIANNEMGLDGGRFGNQLFQYASLYGIAKKNNYQYGIPYQHRNSNEYYDMCLSDCFDNLGALDSSFSTFSNYIRDEEWVFNSDFFKIQDDTNLCGYFQAEKYFSHCKYEVKEQFEFNLSIKEKANSFFVDGSNLISIHLRLGDFQKHKTHFPVCNSDYYRKALSKLPNDCDIAVFSDDIPTTKSMLEDVLKNRKVIYPNSNNKFVDMHLMSRCSYHVIANSSFSWWGAWLSNSKKIIAPKEWVGIDNRLYGKHYDAYCESWEVL